MESTKTADSRRRSEVSGAANNRADSAYGKEIGRLVRLGRAKRGMTRRQLAEDSGTSERYLAQIESGAGNPSVFVMRAIAEALEIPIASLLPGNLAYSGLLGRILDLLGELPPAALPTFADLLEQHVGHVSTADRARRIALVGLRGAGKSTLGRLLAGTLGVEFVELDRVIEEEYGASVPALIEMSGVAAFRRYERAALERVIEDYNAAVIATAGGIVSNPETYAMLLRRAHTVWIRARPEEHMSRVMQQGDFRPMAKNREAMADLVAILEARTADYARALATLDTSDATIEQSAATLNEIVTPLLKA